MFALTMLTVILACVFCSEPSNFNQSVNQCISLLPVPEQSLATSQRLFIFNMAEQEGF